MSGIKKVINLIVVVGLLSSFVACKGDPAVKKQKYLESGNRYLEKKQFKEAAIQYQNAIQIDPKFAEAHYKLSQAFMGVGNFQGAFTELKKTVDAKPEDLRAQIDLGNLYIAGRNWFEAEQVANQILAKDPNNAGAHALLGNVNAGQKKLAEAKAETAKAIELDPKNRRTFTTAVWLGKRRVTMTRRLRTFQKRLRWSRARRKPTTIARMFDE